jgi:predicted anti-sigma-YlaC factor YlaD
MNCNEISDKLSLYIDDELSSEEMKQVEEHLNSCENCQKVLDEYRNLISVLKNLPEEEPPLEKIFFLETFRNTRPQEKGSKLAILFYSLVFRFPELLCIQPPKACP